MFLDPPASRALSQTFKFPIQQQKQQVAQVFSNQERAVLWSSRRKRGILGFRIHSLEEEELGTAQVPSSSSSTQLNMRFTPPSSSLSSSSRKVSVSKVDSSSWNLPEPLSLEASGAYSSSSSRSSTSRPVTAIPWIPSDEDVESLTVVQLKTELEARGLKKTGRKADLQQRLREWTENQKQRRGGGSSGNDLLSSLNLNQAYGDRETLTTSNRPQLPRLEANSLAEWARTVDLEPLLQRREEIHREKREGKKTATRSKPPTVLPENYLAVLNKVFEKPSSVSNRDVKQMYAAAKKADQMGDRKLSKRILQELLRATPHDARIYRRLARLEKEEGSHAKARAVLQEGLDLHPKNAFLWHGLGQLEKGNEAEQKRCFSKAIEVDPLLPHSYHALGTLEHLQGRVANAMKTLKKGIEHCRTNHRLHHALGDLYRDAKMLDMAESSYKRALKYGPYVSHGFAYTALAYTAYERGEVEQCRRWLYKAVRQHNGRHANAWVALAQLEESEGYIDAARSTCIAGIAQYERGLLERSRDRNSKTHNMDDAALLLDPETLKNQFLKYHIPTYRSGDRFFNLYRNWLRLEERHGTIETVEEVYDRASATFPYEWRLALDAAQYYVKLDLHDRARARFVEACNRAGSRHADPYRLFAEFEVSRGNVEEAQKILYLGASLTSSEQDLEHGSKRVGQSELFLTWAVCEWHLGSFGNAEKLFDHALELSAPASIDHDDSSKLRALILYSRARFEYFREEHRRAQHFIGLCLAENLMPFGKSKVWALWAAVAYELGDAELAHQCQKHGVEARLDEDDENDSAAGTLSRVLKGADMQHLMRRDPWHTKIFGSESNDKLMSLGLLPEKEMKPVTRRRRHVTGPGRR